MKRKAICGIYMLSWPDETFVEYFYFGQSINIRNRYFQHINRLKSGKHDNPIIQRIYNKYGEPECEIVKRCSPASLEKEEQKFCTNKTFNKG